MARVLAIPDLHAPFQHPKALEFLISVYKRFQCDRVVCLGDEVDFHALSKYPSDPDGFSPGHELLYAQAFLEEMYKAFPCVQVCTSNHTSRPFRKAYEYGIPESMVRSYKEFLKAPDAWQWSDEIVIDNVLYIHGEGYSGQNAHVRAANLHRKSVVMGHIHSHAGIQYFQTSHSRIFGMNSGCLIDPKAYAFKYAKKMAVKPTLGCSVIIDGYVGYFIPLTEITK